MPSNDDHERTPLGSNDGGDDGSNGTSNQGTTGDASEHSGSEPSAREPGPADGITDEIRVQNEEVRRRWHAHPALRIFMRIVVAVAGVLLGILIGGHTTADIGPIKVSADLLIGPGNATLRIPPLGALEVEAYEGPIRLELTVLQVDQEKATDYVNGTKSLDELTAAVESDLQSTLVTLVVKTAIGAIIGGIVVSILLFRRWRDSFVAAGTSLALIVATGLVGYLTFDGKSFQQPTYTGLLTQAPAIVGNVDDLAEKFADYRKALVKLVTNISTLYTTISTLPTDTEIADTIKVLHVSDIHMNPSGFDLMSNLVEQFGVDFVIDTGDLVDWGTSQEAMTFSTIGAIEVPYVYIRGNHDSMTTQQQVSAYSNVIVLDKSETEVDGLTIAGIGDPRFSPDRTTYNDTSLDDAVEASAEAFDKYLDDLPSMPDIVLFHDPAGAKILADSAPLILSGHKHKRAVTQLDDDTLLMVQGSTGGAGLRGLEGEEPTPLSASVLYFDAQTHDLRAWDDITVGGLGETDVSITRTLAPEAVEEAEQSATSISQSAESASSASESESSREPSDSTPSDGTEPASPPETPSQPTTTGAPQGPGN